MKKSIDLIGNFFPVTCSVVFLVLVSTLAVHGQSIQEETFSYPAGTLAARDGGSGWLGAWTAAAGKPTSSVSTAGLNFPGLTTSGGTLLDSDGSEFASTRKWFEPATTIPNGTTVWFSTLVSYNVNHNSDLLLGATDSSAGAATVTILENEENPDNVKVSIPLSTAGRPFMRLKANRP